METARRLGFRKGEFVHTGAFPGIIIGAVNTATPLCEVWGLDHEMGSAYAKDLTLLPWPQFESNALACYIVTPVTPPQPPVIRFVTYACKEIDGTAGLWRTSQAVGAVRARLTVTPELVLPDCEQLAFRYASWSSSQPSSEPQPIDWKVQWSEAQRQLPRLVEVSVTRSSRDPVRRVFAIPVGQGSPAGP